MRVETVGLERMENFQRCVVGRWDRPECGVKAIYRMTCPLFSLGRDSTPSPLFLSHLWAMSSLAWNLCLPPPLDYIWGTGVVPSWAQDRGHT